MIHFSDLHLWSLPSSSPSQISSFSSWWMVTLPLCIDYLVSESHALLNYKYCNTCVSCAAIISTLYSRNIHVAESVMYSCRICRIHTHDTSQRRWCDEMFHITATTVWIIFLLLCHVHVTFMSWMECDVMSEPVTTLSNVHQWPGHWSWLCPDR